MESLLDEEAPDSYNRIAFASACLFFTGCTCARWRRIEVVITGRTRNALAGFRLEGSNPSVSARFQILKA